MRQKYFYYPFAIGGDKAVIPDQIQPAGSVSLQAGWPFNYQRDLATDPLALPITRDTMNWLFNSITENLQQYQDQGFPEWNGALNPDGSTHEYPENAIVAYSPSGDPPFSLWISMVSGNSAEPGTDPTKWQQVSLRADNIQGSSAFMAESVRTTGPEQYTASFTPAVTDAFLAGGTARFFVRAPAANTTTTPLFQADGSAAKTITRGNGQPLLVGDIVGAGFWMLLAYDPVLDVYNLLNPETTVVADATTTSKGIVRLATDAEAQAFINQETVITPYTLAQALKGTNQNLTALSGHQIFPGGLYMQWTYSGWLTAEGPITLNWPNGAFNSILTVSCSTQNNTADPPFDGNDSMFQVTSWTNNDITIYLQRMSKCDHQIRALVIGFGT